MTNQVGALFTLKDNFTATFTRLKKETESFRRDANDTQATISRTFSNGRRSADGFNRSVRNASNGMRSLGSSASSSFGSILKGAAAATAAIGGIMATKSLVENSLKLSSDAEQANIAFETMLGSADKAKTFLTNLSDFANKTPFELPQLRDASKRMLAFGFSAESVVPTLTAVGDAAAGLGMGQDGVERITLALGQMRAKAKVSGDEMMQLTEAGVPAWEILAKKMNMTTAEVMKMSEKGLIPADKAINMLVDGMESRFPQMMSKQSKTLQGLYSTMKDTFNNKILVKFGDGIASALKPRFDQLVTWIDQNGATLDRWATKVQNSALKATDFLAKQFESAFTYVKSHFLDNPKFQSLPDLKSKIKFVFDDLSKTFSNWLDSGGKSTIQKTSDEAVQLIVNSLQAALPKLTPIAITIGGSIAEGVIAGFKKSARDIPIIGNLIKGDEKINNSFNNLLAGKGVDEKGNSYWDWVKNRFANNPFAKPKPDGSHANGLAYVPKDGYMAELHKGERVLTAQENKTYLQSTSNSSNTLNKQGNNITININGTNLTVSELVAEFVPQLKIALANG